MVAAAETVTVALTVPVETTTYSGYRLNGKDIGNSNGNAGGNDTDHCFGGKRNGNGIGNSNGNAEDNGNGNGNASGNGMVTSTHRVMVGAAVTVT